MTCAAEGGYLAIINNEVEARALSEIYEEMGFEIPSAGTYFTNSAYIGFLDWGQLGEWLTIHGKSRALLSYIILKYNIMSKVT